MHFTADGLKKVSEIAARHEFGKDAGLAMAEAMLTSRGAMAQFNHPEFGGMGQWSQGGMLMIGDMFNNGLKARVGALAQDLASALGSGEIVAKSPGGGAETSQWWPGSLGQPSSTGSQNGRRYAVFPEARRVAIEEAGRVRVFDSADYRIGGASQQQGGSSHVAFGTDRGQISISDLKEILDPSDGRGSEEPKASVMSTGSVVQPVPDIPLSTQQPEAGRHEPASSVSRADPIELLSRLADLKSKGILSDEEFKAKKAEILTRI